MCVRRELDGHFNVEVCTCQDDLCNDANVVENRSALSLLATALILIYLNIS